MHKNFFIFISAAVLIFFAQSAQAAVLYALPEKSVVAIGESFNVDLKVNTEDVSINAAQATVRFPSSIIELVEFDNSVSAFNFWVEEPLISNEEGTLKFIGGTTNGISGQTLQVIKMKFKAVSAGESQISVNDALVTAADGRGTNVLSKIEGAAIRVSPEVVLPQAPAVPPSVIPPAVAPQVPVEQPEAVVRPPLPAVGLPSQPKLRVPLYPDESRWYSHLGEVIVFWEVPEDVIRVATAIDKNPGASPENIEKELFTGRSFGALSEGTWYAHVQFRNNIGWGPEAHYKISIDTTPPVQFEAGIDNEVSDNPSPKISFESFDSLSGVDKTLIYFDGKEPVDSQEKSLVLPPQGPGRHQLRVQILDKAGNSVEDSLEFEILPLQTPIVEFIAKKITRDQQVFVSGISLPDYFVDLHVYNKAGQEIDLETARADSLGRWSISLTKPLLLGEYTLTAIARDDRMALSYASPQESFTVRPATVVSLGPLDLGWFEIFIIIILFAAAGFGFYGWYYLGLKRKREAYAVIVARDVEKMHNLLKENLDKLETNIKNLDKFINPISKDIDSTLKAESLTFVKRMQEVLDKIRKYVKQEVEGLR